MREKEGKFVLKEIEGGRGVAWMGVESGLSGELESNNLLSGKEVGHPAIGRGVRLYCRRIGKG
jgi:hypothetical protein